MKVVKSRTRTAADVKDHWQHVANDPLSTLRAELDRELAYLRDPKAGSELRRLFDATPDELAHAANALRA